jgi:hypothetical protein
MAAKKPKGAPAERAPDLEAINRLRTEAGQSGEEAAQCLLDAEPPIVRELKEYTAEWKVRAALARAFDPGNLIVENGVVLPNFAAVCDRLDDSVGADNWNVVDLPGGIAMEVTFGSKFARRVCATDKDDSYDVRLATVAVLFGIGRYLLRSGIEIGKPLPAWALPPGSDGLPVYGQWKTDPVAATAPPPKPQTVKPEPPPAPKPEPEAPKVEAASTPEARAFAVKTYWYGRAGLCATPSELNRVLSSDEIKKVQLKRDAWEGVRAAAGEKGWLFDVDRREFYAPDEPEPETIPW